MRTVEDRPGEILRWQASPGAQLPLEGSVRFGPTLGDWGKVVTLRFRFDPPGGVLGDAALKLLGGGPGLLASKALRQAILACRKGGTLSILGVYGVMDKFPVGVMMNKGLTVRTAQQHGQAYLPRLLERASKGELNPSYLITHRFSLEEAPHGYEMFKHKKDGCVRVVFTP